MRIKIIIPHGLFLIFHLILHLFCPGLHPDTDYNAIDAAESWLQRLLNAATPTESIVGSYLNYIDPYLQDWQSMYYRNHWDRLREMKTKWDPTWYFRFPQGIPPNTDKSSAVVWNSHLSVFVVAFIHVLKFNRF